MHVLDEKSQTDRKYGALAKTCNMHGSTALHKLCEESGSRHISSNSQDRNEHSDAIDPLLNADLDINVVDSDANTALHHAAMGSNIILSRR